MKGFFIFLIVISMLFFIAKLGLTIWQRTLTQKYYNNLLVKCLNDYTIIGYIILVYSLSISLYLAGDYTTSESNFTLIILSIATALFVAEKIYLSVKNRGYLYIESNIYDLKSLVKKEEYEGVLRQESKTYFVLKDKEKFEQLLESEEVCDSKKLLTKRLVAVCLANIGGLLLSILILVVGLVRGA